MTSSQFQPVGNEAKKSGQGSLGLFWPLNSDCLTAHTENVTAPVQWPSSPSPLNTYLPLPPTLPLQAYGRPSSGYSPQGRAGFLLVSLHCPTLVQGTRCNFINNPYLLALSVFCQDPDGYTQRGQLIKSAILGGDKWLQPPSYQSQEVLKTEDQYVQNNLYK